MYYVSKELPNQKNRQNRIVDIRCSGKIVTTQSVIINFSKNKRSLSVNY